MTCPHNCLDFRARGVCKHVPHLAEPSTTELCNHPFATDGKQWFRCTMPKGHKPGGHAVLEKEKQ